MAEDFAVSNDISIPLGEIEFSAIRAQGAGGQNVNKVASAIHLRFDLLHCAAIPEAVKSRLLQGNDQRITADGVVVIKAQRFRTQERNKREALERLAELLQSALVVAKPRKPTRISRGKKEQRLESKRKRGQLKKHRGRVDEP